MAGRGGRWWRREKEIGIGEELARKSRGHVSVQTTSDGEHERAYEKEREVRITTTCGDDEGTEEKEREVGLKNGLPFRGQHPKTWGKGEIGKGGVTKPSRQYETRSTEENQTRGCEKCHPKNGLQHEYLQEI